MLKQDEQTRIRLPKSLKEEFRDSCESMGLSMSSGVRLGMHQVMEMSKKMKHEGGRAAKLDLPQNPSNEDQYVK